MGNLIKPTMLVTAPVDTLSGYGSRSKDLVRALIQLYGDTYDIKINSLRWGNTPSNVLKSPEDDDIISRILTHTNQLTRQPEIHFQVSIPSEFNPIASICNIGVTAGIETTTPPASWIEGVNRMNVTFASSRFSANGLLGTEFVKHDNQRNIPVGTIKINKPIEVLFEGIDTNIYKRIKEEDYPKDKMIELNEIPEDFCYLFTGHWIHGGFGHDRKDIGSMIQVFLETFKNNPKAPALVLKISHGTLSEMDKNSILDKIQQIKRSIVAETYPSIYLLYGYLTDNEMNLLYNHPKIKAMVSFTHGEGYFRPLAEFTMIGKPVIVSGWSGHLDYLNADQSLLLPGELVELDESVLNDWFIKGAKWFKVDYEIASKALVEMFINYNKHLNKARQLMYSNRNSFSFESMKYSIKQLLHRYIPDYPVEYKIQMPVKKIKLPTLKNKVQSGTEIKGTNNE